MITASSLAGTPCMIAFKILPKVVVYWISLLISAGALPVAAFEPLPVRGLRREKSFGRRHVSRKKCEVSTGVGNNYFFFLGGMTSGGR